MPMKDKWTEIQEATLCSLISCDQGSYSVPLDLHFLSKLWMSGDRMGEWTLRAYLT